MRGLAVKLCLLRISETTHMKNHQTYVSKHGLKMTIIDMLKFVWEVHKASVLAHELLAAKEC